MQTKRKCDSYTNKKDEGKTVSVYVTSQILEWLFLAKIPTVVAEWSWVVVSSIEGVNSINLIDTFTHNIRSNTEDLLRNKCQSTLFHCPFERYHAIARINMRY